jgi:hypothetical protein
MTEALAAIRSQVVRRFGRGNHARVLLTAYEDLKHPSHNDISSPQCVDIKLSHYSSQWVEVVSFSVSCVLGLGSRA